VTPFITRTLKISKVRNLPQSKPDDKEDYSISGLDWQQHQLSVLQIKIYVGNELCFILTPTNLNIYIAFN